MAFTKEDTAKTKGIAVILLLFHHLFFTKRGYEIELCFISQDALMQFAVAARICVWIFVFLSAYGITLQFERKAEDVTTSDFLKKRWISLMSGYWFVYLLVFLGMLFFGKKPMGIYDNSLINMLLDAFAVSDFFKTPTMRGAWWYMCFAQMQLFSIPTIYLFSKKLGGLNVFVLLLLGSQYLNGAITSASGGDYLMYTYGTLFGILCAQYRFFEKMRPMKSYKAVLRIIVVFAVVVLGIYLRFVVIREGFPYNARQIDRVTYGVSAVGIALLTVLLKGKLRKLQIGKILMFLGSHSGNIYLIHMFWVKYFGKWIFITKNVFLTLISLLALSCMTSVIIEELKKLLRYDQLLMRLKR